MINKKLKQAKITVVNYRDTVKLYGWMVAGYEMNLSISTATDSVYFYSVSIQGITPLIEFTANCSVLDVRDPKNPKSLGFIDITSGYEYGKALVFESYTPNVEYSQMSIIYAKPSVEIYINFELAICKCLTEDKSFKTLNQFLDRDWVALKKAQLHHRDLNILFKM